MNRSCIASLAILALAAYPAAAQTLYQQNFDALASASTTTTPGTYVAVDDVGGSGWQIQGGTGGGGITLTAGIDGNGVGGSQALFGTWDTSGGSSYTWNQYTYYGVGGAGAGATLANIDVSLDIFMSGSDSSTPIMVSALQSSGSISLDFTPTLANDSYTHVQFTLDQATATGGSFDPTAEFWFRLSHGNGGFGFDNPNTVQIDNVMIQVVPEPTAAALLGLSALGLIWLRRRS